MTVAIMACHNRVEFTSACLAAARGSAQRAGAELRFVVFDDGSDDGTAELLSGGGDVTTLTGDGSAYWAKGMAEAEREALRRMPDHEALLWLNDDVVLDSTALGRIQDAVAGQQSTVWVGATREPGSSSISYSGLRRTGVHPLHLTLVEPRERPQAVDTFNGNVVFLSAGLARRLGGIDGGFGHAFADIDYGLRARRGGVPVLLAAGTFGSCSRGRREPAPSILTEWREFTSMTGGGNFASLRRLLRRDHRAAWMAPILASYLLWWARRFPRLLGMEGRR